MKYLILLLLPCSLFAQTPKFQTSWETGTRGSGLQTVEDVAPDTGVTISTVWARTGTKSIRFALKNTDPEAQFQNKRREITVVNNNSVASQDTLITWYRWSNYWPTNGSQSDTREDIFTQWHDKSAPCSASPTLAFETINGKIRFKIRYSTANYCTVTSSRKEVILPITIDIPLNKAVDWVVYYKPKTDGTGRVIVYMTVDGVTKTVVDYAGPCQYIGSQFPYWKIGIYKWVWMQSLPGGAPNYRQVFFDALAYGREGNTYASMSLAGTPPTPNQPPTVSVGANASYTAGTTSAPLDATATDPEGQSMTYAWTKTAGPTVIINNGTTKNATVTGLTDNNTYSFQFTATDAQGAATTASKSITIAAANVPPTVTMGSNQSLSAGATTGTITATAADSDGTLSSGTWSQLSGPNTAGIANPNDASPGTSSTGLTGLITGTYTFKYQVVDNNGAIASGTVNVTVPAVNVTPVVTPAPPYILLNSATSTSINATSTDADGTISTRLWTQLSGPNTATIVSSGSATTSVTGLIVGTYIFLHTATDNSGGTGSATVTVEVNNPPVIDLSGVVDFTFPNLTSSISITASATDADGTIASYAWSGIEGPTTPTFTPSNTASTTMTNLTTGSYIVRLTVTDNDGASSSSDYSFTIEAKYIITKFGVKKVLKH